MDTTGFTLFDTALGRCGIAWGLHGIVAVALPEADEQALRTRTRRAVPAGHESPPPADVARAIDEIVALLEGEPRDLTGVVLDMEHLPEFNRRVYAVARSVAPGETITYGEIAERIGERGAAQAVGQALGRNPFPIVVPCHRVLAAGGGMGGFSARGGVATKRRMLAIEGAGTPALFA
jgi:methylated-DNA-[protein]-cysteine S-methyltransferase